MRETIIAGNWKMNRTPEEASALVGEILPGASDAKCRVVICVPSICIERAVSAAAGSDVKIGAQNMHWEQSGAYTGEISAGMLVSAGVGYVIIGHSERRQYFGETDCTVAKKVPAAIMAGLVPIVCVGETLEERELGVTFETVARQVKIALSELDPGAVSGTVIAYEPVWAIGTGKTASAAEANAVCAFIRETVAGLYGSQAADAVPILYGGSMNAANAGELLGTPSIDGGLIGGASLKPDDFSKIIEAANALY